MQIMLKMHPRPLSSRLKIVHHINIYIQDDCMMVAVGCNYQEEPGCR